MKNIFITVAMLSIFTFSCINEEDPTSINNYRPSSEYKVFLKTTLNGKSNSKNFSSQLHPIEISLTDDLQVFGQVFKPKENEAIKGFFVEIQLEDEWGRMLDTDKVFLEDKEYQYYKIEIPSLLHDIGTYIIRMGVSIENTIDYRENKYFDRNTYLTNYHSSPLKITVK